MVCIPTLALSKFTVALEQGLQAFLSPLYTEGDSTKVAVVTLQVGGKPPLLSGPLHPHVRLGDMTVPPHTHSTEPRSWLCPRGIPSIVCI